MVTILATSVYGLGMTGTEDVCHAVNDGYGGLKLFYRVQVSNRDSFTES